MELTKIDQIHQAIMQAETLPEIKDIRDKLEAIRMYAKRAKLGFEMQNKAAEMKVRAERRAGEMLVENGFGKQGGDRKSSSMMLLENVGIDKFQSSRWRQICSLSIEIFEQYITLAWENEIEITEVSLLKLAKNPLSQPMEILLSHESVDYYTPAIYIEAARHVMGGIDLDPASCSEAQEIVKAERYFTKDNNGLLEEWQGRIWLNPPYSKTGGKSNQELWAEYLFQEYERGSVTEAILLVKSALGYNWFESLWDRWAACFVRQRLSFIKSDGSTDGQSKHGTAFFYVGSNLQKFINVFSEFGRITTPDGNYVCQE